METDVNEPEPPALLDPQTAQEVPAWLVEVERLRKNPAALAGGVSFTSPDDLTGRIDLGSSVDKPADEDQDFLSALI